MKRRISIFLMFVFLLCINPTTSHAKAININNEGSIYLSAEEKTDFQKIKDLEFQNNYKQGKIKKTDAEQIETLMLKATSINADKAAIYAELESYGSYVLNPSDNEVTILSDTTDVYLSTPTIYYNSWNMTWTVTCGGGWSSNNYLDDYPIIGENVGGPDGFGVGFTQVSGNTTGAVDSVSGYLSDGNGNYSSTSYRSDGGDGSKGFGFRIQDYRYSRGSYTSYIGKEFAGLCNYDRYFGSMSGIATGYYIHTWDKAMITSITFGINGKTAGISATISNASKSFTVYSNDKRFGVY